MQTKSNSITLDPVVILDRIAQANKLNVRLQDSPFSNYTIEIQQGSVDLSANIAYATFFVKQYSTITIVENIPVEIGDSQTTVKLSKYLGGANKQNLKEMLRRMVDNSSLKITLNK